MSNPANLQIPNSVVGDFRTKANQKYSVSFDFVAADNSVPWEVGILLNGLDQNGSSLNRFISTAGNTPPSNSDFNFTGNGGSIECAFILSTTGATPGDTSWTTVNVGYGAAENAQYAAQLRITKCEDNVSGLRNLQNTPMAPTPDLNYPFIWNLMDWAGSGYSGDLRIENISTPQKSVIIGIYDKNGALVSYFDKNDVSTVVVPINAQNPIYLISFLEVKVTGSGKFKFQVGDPRDEATMEIDEDNDVMLKAKK